MKSLKAICGAVLCWAMLLTFTGLSSASSANGEATWWNEQWSVRKKITLNATPAGADIQETLAEVPVLLRLHSGNFTFTGAREDGGDLRFVAGDDKTVLKHHLVQFDAIDEMALVWVTVPRITGASEQDSIWLYHGNEKAEAPAEGTAIYDAGQVAVLHLDEMEGLPMDATAYKNNPSESTGVPGSPGIVGNAMAFYGNGEHFVLSPAPSLKFTDGLTFSTWLRVASPLSGATILSMGTKGDSLTIGIDGASPFLRLEGNSKVSLTAGTGFTPNEWQHLGVTIGGGKATLFVNGVQAGQADFPGKLPEYATGVTVGTQAEGGNPFSGELDEIELASVARPAGWMKAAFAGQGPAANLAGLGLDEKNEGGGAMLLTYLQIIVGHIEWDGWVILACMIIMIILCWCVIISKFIFFSQNDKENQAFRKMLGRKEGTDQYIEDNHKDEFRQSSLYQVYQHGCEELSKLLASAREHGKPGLTAKDLNAFRASLEKGFVQETKEYSAWLPILTMSITGGPFMGLLGTVWGVMITFAGMAAAGEASIMAIAPGIASALVCTVFGLLVAIPALFGYNYLVNRLKNLTVDLSVFTEEFAIKIERQYGAN